MLQEGGKTVHTLDEIREEYLRLDRVCGIDSSRIELRINNAKKRLGSFSCRPGFPGRKMSITISRKALQDDALFLDTIRHEYAHAVVSIREPFSRHGHDRVWKAVCREVGCTPRATLKETGGQNTEKEAKYRVTCLGCGAESGYLRAGKIVRLLQDEERSGWKKNAGVLCRKCGGKHFRLTQLR